MSVADLYPFHVPVCCLHPRIQHFHFNWSTLKVQRLLLQSKLKTAEQQLQSKLKEIETAQQELQASRDKLKSHKSDLKTATSELQAARHASDSCKSTLVKVSTQHHSCRTFASLLCCCMYDLYVLYELCSSVCSLQELVGAYFLCTMMQVNLCFRCSTNH